MVRGRLLVVDDEAAALAGIVALFEDELDVFAVGSIAEAHSAMDVVEFDVVVTDYQMPGGTGLDVIQRAGERLPNAVCILYTGREDLARAKAQASGWRVISKSAGPDLLLSAVRQAVTLSRLRSSVSALKK